MAFLVFHIGGSLIDSPTFAVGDSYCAISNSLALGSYTYPGTGTQLYVTGNTTLNGTLSVTSGGASITGSTVAQDITCTTLTASGTVSGTGFASLLSPYALATSISRYTASSPISFSYVTTFNSPDQGLSLIHI